MTATKLKRSLNCLLLALIFLFGTGNMIYGQNETAFKYSGGDDEIDQMRKEIKIHPNDESNNEYRGAMLKLWELALQQQGAILSGRYHPVYIRTSTIESIQLFSKNCFIKDVNNLKYDLHDYN